jgi:hypothetical protein
MIQSSALYELKEALGAAKMVSGSLTLSALATGSSWPLVTSHDFEFYARPWLESSNCVFISFLPLVSGGELDTWNEYSVKNQEWINKSFEIDDEERPNPYASIPPAAYSLQMQNEDMIQVNESGRLPVVPLWQMSPPPLDPAPVNFNALSAEWFRTPFLSKLPSLGDGTPALSLLNLTLLNTSDDGTTTTTMSGNNKLTSEPLSLMLNPIYEKPKDNASTVGAVWSMLPWGAYLTNSLAANVSGVVAVLRCSCSEKLAYGYEITSNRAVYMGPIDSHDPDYDAYEYIFTLSPGDIEDGGENESSSTADSATNPKRASCSYAFYLYPTPDFEQHFVSGQPLSAALVVGAVFAVLVIAFLVYERFTSIKNKKLVSIVARSNRLIATLFPEGVRERLFAEEDERNNKAGPRTADQLRALLRDDPLADAGGENDDEVSEVDFTSKPIADLCKHFSESSTAALSMSLAAFKTELTPCCVVSDPVPETTILFADIVGFTSWSSMRQPSDVFALLETLYRAFDSIAERRRIFKVSIDIRVRCFLTGHESGTEFDQSLTDFVVPLLSSFSRLRRWAIATSLPQVYRRHAKTTLWPWRSSPTRC